MPRWYVAACVAAISLLGSSSAGAQTREIRVRGFADLGSTAFAADQSFKAVLGSNRGAVLGGGGEVVLPRRIFVHVRASRFSRTGQRVFVIGGEQFGLRIPTTVTVTPVELAGGYRLEYGWRVYRWRVVPYGGAGVGWHRYAETSRFADRDENVSKRFQGYQIVGGAEIPVARWIGAAFEAQWATVPDALGTDPSGVSREFQESNLGGATVRVKIVVGP